MCDQNSSFLQGPLKCELHKLGKEDRVLPLFPTSLVLYLSPAKFFKSPKGLLDFCLFSLKSFVCSSTCLSVSDLSHSAVGCMTQGEISGTRWVPVSKCGGYPAVVSSLSSWVPAVVLCRYHVQDRLRVCQNRELSQRSHSQHAPCWAIQTFAFLRKQRWMLPDYFHPRIQFSKIALACLTLVTFSLLASNLA